MKLIAALLAIFVTTASVSFVAIQHGPDVECKQICVPGGFEEEEEAEVPVVACRGTSGDSCAKQGKSCGQEHRSGCTEYCRAQCCRCCGI